MMESVSEKMQGGSKMSLDVEAIRKRWSNLPQWRIERVHDLWVEIRAGFGCENHMVADCLRPADAERIVAAQTDIPALCNELTAARALLAAAGREVG